MSARKGCFCKFSHKFYCNLSISFVENISMLDNSRKLVPCVKVDYENKKLMLLNPSVQFFIDARGSLLIERKGMYYAA